MAQQDADVSLKGKFGTVPQWATAILMAVVAFFLSQTYKDWSGQLATLNLWRAESQKRLELIELRYDITDAERRQAINDLRNAQQQTVAELKALNAQVTKMINNGHSSFQPKD